MIMHVSIYAHNPLTQCTHVHVLREGACWLEFPLSMLGPKAMLVWMRVGLVGEHEKREGDGISFGICREDGRAMTSRLG